MPSGLKLIFKFLALRILVLSGQTKVVVVEKDQIVIISSISYLIAQNFG